jgi:hypothetical protein
VRARESTRRVTHVISTAALDRGNRIVEPAGWKLAKFKDNPVVLADHDYAIERIIGRAYDTKIEGDALISTTEFAGEGLGNVAFRLVQAGIVKAWSVGWIGLKAHRFGEVDGCAVCQAAVKKVDYGRHFVQQELLEYSLVAVPANPDAVMGLSTAGLVAPAEADEWISACESRKPSEIAAAAVEAEPVEAPPVSRSGEFWDALFLSSPPVARPPSLRCSQQVRRYMK